MILSVPPSGEPLFPIVPSSASTETLTEWAISTIFFVIATLSSYAPEDASIMTDV